eukprot:1086870-Pyramimonas_sp.AAC.1
MVRGVLGTCGRANEDAAVHAKANASSDGGPASTAKRGLRSLGSNVRQPLRIGGTRGAPESN